MPLPHDNSGFLIGEKIAAGLDDLKADTAEILKIMYRRAGDGDGHRPAGSAPRGPRQTRDFGGREPGSGSGSDSAGAQGIVPTAQEGAPRRKRDANGRFTGAGAGAESSPAKSRGLISRFVDAIRGRLGVGSANADGVDPTITAIHEAAQIAAPFTKAAGWLFGKKKDELPKEEHKHNKTQEGLLTKILGQLRRGGVGVASGLRLPVIGGFIGGLVERFAPMLGRLVPMFGGLLVKGLGLAVAWKGGQAIGKWIYDAIGPTLGEWIDSTVSAYQDSIKTASGWIEKAASAWDSAVATVSAAMEKIAGWFHLDIGSAKIRERDNPGTKDNYNAIMQEEYGKLGYSPMEMAALKGMIHQESHFDPKAASPKGAFGLGQAMPATAAKYHVIRGDSPEAARSQIHGEGEMMKDLLSQFGGDWDKARAAYNWGSGNLQKAISKYGDDWRAHLPAETSDYLKKTKLYATKYTGDFIGSATSPVSTAASKVFSSSVPKPPAYGPGMGVLKIPPAPTVTQQLGGKPAAIPVFLQNSPADISQNVSDRNLAHAITGGLGMDFMRGQ